MFKLCIGFRIDARSILFFLGVDLGIILGPCWASFGGIGDIANIIENLLVFNDFPSFWGSKLASFSYVSVVYVSKSFFDCLGVGLWIVKMVTQTNEKRTCKKVTQDILKSCDRCGDLPLSSQKRTIPGLATSQGTRDTPLVPGGTVADIYIYIYTFFRSSKRVYFVCVVEES